MKRILLLLSLFVVTTLSAEVLSDSSKISVITCGPGEVIYAQFGHTAIRVQDPSLHFDLIFNYGTFNRRQPHFLEKFVKGQTDYSLGLQIFEFFYTDYVANGMYIWEQELNLSLEERQQVFDKLMLNYLPQNREYRYNFAFDNCATRPRDIIEEIVGTDINYHFKGKTDTFRELVRACTGHNTWMGCGIDMVFGPTADIVATERERMFLPLELMHYYTTATIADGRPLVKSTVQIAALPALSPEPIPFATPMHVSIYIMLIVFALSYVYRNKKALWLDVVVFSLTVPFALLALYLTTSSSHPFVGQNLNLLWLQPLNIVFLLLLPFKRIRKALAYYQIVNAALILFTIAGYLFLPQSFRIEFLPIMLVLFVRAILFYQNNRVSLPKS